MATSVGKLLVRLSVVALVVVAVVQVYRADFWAQPTLRPLETLRLGHERPSTIAFHSRAGANHLR